MLTKGIATLVVGDESKAIKVSWMISEGKTIETNYTELSEGRWGISKLLHKDPDTVIVTGTPKASYALQFIKMLVSSPTLPCDLPNKPLRIKATPNFIFCIPSKEPIKLETRFKTIWCSADL